MYPFGCAYRYFNFLSGGRIWTFRNPLSARGDPTVLGVGILRSLSVSNLVFAYTHFELIERYPAHNVTLYGPRLIMPERARARATKDENEDEEAEEEEEEKDGASRL